MKYVVGDRVYISTTNSLGPRKYLTGTIYEVYTSDIGISMAGVEIDGNLPTSNMVHISCDALERISDVYNN